MYAAVAVRDGPVAFARVALPLTAVEERVAHVRRLALIGLAAGLVAAVAADVARRPLLLNRRLARGRRDVARRYRAGDFGAAGARLRPRRNRHRRDVLDETARELGARLTDMARERAHTDAILTRHGRGRRARRTRPAGSC